MKVRVKSPRHDYVWFTADKLQVGEYAICENTDEGVVMLAQSANDYKKYLVWLMNGVCTANLGAYTVRHLRDDESINITNK